MTFKDIDKIYFLHLSDRYDREKWMMNQIKQIGFPKNKLNIWWTCRRPITNEISKYIPDLHNGQYQAYVNTSNPSIGGSTFNCAFEHYSIIRTSYERGFKHILIFEDDVEFLVDLNIFKKFIKLLPDNYNICKFHYRLCDWGNNNNILCDSSNNKEIPNINNKICNPYSLYKDHGQFVDNEYFSTSSAAYMIDRKGMKSIINSLHKSFCTYDIVFWNINDVNIYHCNYQLLTTQDHNRPNHLKLISDIGPSNTDLRFNQFK